MNTTPYKYKHVVLLGVDGAGNFFRQADTPNMDRIFASGATNYDVLTAIPTISAECWGSMLIGSSAPVHGLTNSIVGSREYDVDSDLPTVFRRIREVMPDATLAAFSNWDPINYGIVEHNLDVTFGTAGDDELTDMILAYLEKNDPTFLFVQFDSVDGAGHGNGYGTPNHLAQITTVDGYIGRIYDLLEKRGLLEETLFLVDADHGGTLCTNGEGAFWGGHGGTTDEEKYVFFGAAGKTVKPGTFGEMNIRDTAAIVLHALGIEIPEFELDAFSGQVPADMFTDYVPAPRRSLASIVVDHETIPTPAADSGKYITDFIDPAKVELVLHFDEKATDSTGKYETVTVGTPKYYTVGYMGSCIEIGKQGYIEIPDLKVGRESFTVSVWFYHDGAIKDDDPAFYGTKEWTVGTSEGFMLAYQEHDFRFNTGNGEEIWDLYQPLPAISRGWINSTLVVDREKDEIRHYFNFNRKRAKKIPVPYSEQSFDNLPFHIGQDGAGNYNKLNFMIDDFILFRGALSEEEIAKLAEYYKADGSKATEAKN